jgi:uncharacterized protein (TIGR00299 family) protein
MKILYIDATNSGISGDMFLAALLSLIPDPNSILNELKNLKDFLPDVSKLNIELLNTVISGIKINQLKLNIKETKHHRNAEVLSNSLNSFLVKHNYSNEAKNYANNVLNTLLKAEAKVHGETESDLHLHELSSVDTLIDISGVSKVLDILGAFSKDFKIICSKIPLGGGKIKTAHGVMPVPAPATLKILENSNIIVYNGPIEAELVTPTGAALLTNLNPKLISYEMTLEKSVYSTGQKKFDNFLNMLRLFYGEHKEIGVLKENEYLQKYFEPISVLETDVDDVSGEVLGNFINNIEKEDILDIQIIPSITKKNRPGHVIKVLCHPKNQYEIITKIIEELGTLGVRFTTINRVCVEREFDDRSIEINEKMYNLRYKISYIDSASGRKIVNIKPEYGDLKKISEESGLSIKDILFVAQEKIQNILYKFKNSQY